VVQGVETVFLLLLPEVRRNRNVQELCFGLRVFAGTRSPTCYKLMFERREGSVTCALEGVPEKKGQRIHRKKLYDGHVTVKELRQAPCLKVLEEGNEPFLALRVRWAEMPLLLIARTTPGLMVKAFGCMDEARRACRFSVPFG